MCVPELHHSALALLSGGALRETMQSMCQISRGRRHGDYCFNFKDLGDEAENPSCLPEPADA